MRKTNRVQQQSMGSLRVRSLGTAQRLVVCIEGISYALLSQRIQSAVAICSIAWLASLWLAAALAQAQESPSNESGISVSQLAPAQTSIATTGASHLVISMVDRNDLEPSASPNLAAQFTDPHSSGLQTAEKVLLPSDSRGSEYASLAALASAPSSSLLNAVQSKGSGHADTGFPANENKSVVYQLGPVNFVLNGLPNSFSVSTVGSGLTWAR